MTRFLGPLLLLYAITAPAPLGAQERTRTPGDSAAIKADSAQVTEEVREVFRDTAAAPPQPAPVIPPAEAAELHDTVTIDGEPGGPVIEELSLEAGPPWRVSYYPYVSGGSDDGVMLAFRVRYWQPAQYTERVTARGALTVDGGLATQGSRFARVRLEAPLLADGWRAAATLLARRQARYGYYGRGNETVFDEDLVTGDQPYYYRVSRTRYQALGEVTRRLSGPLSLALLGGVELARFHDLPGPSVFRQDFGSELEQTDYLARLALVLDTRNNEFNPSSGALLQAGAQVGSGGDGYTRLYVAGRGYLPLRPGTLLAARVVASGMGGSPPLNATFSIPLWEDPISIYGGDESNRGLEAGRFTGRHALFGSMELRQDLFYFGHGLGAITLIGFVDAGRTFEQDFEFTFDTLHVGAGGGIGIRLLRATIFTVNVARGSDGTEFSITSGWAF